MDPTRPETVEPEIIFAATLYLMTQHARSRSPLLARVVARQLGYIAEHPSGEVPDVLRAVCQNLQSRWMRIAASTAAPALPPPDKAGNKSSVH